jgi:hypothetical protein
MYAATELIGIEMYHGRNQPTTWVNILGEPIPPERVDEIQLKYSMPPEKDQKAVLGNYWWVVRLRPIRGTKTRKYEYMVNKEYTYSRMSWDFTQHKTFQLSANRWYYEGPIDKTLSLCLYPYYQYCPGSDIDFRRCLIHVPVLPVLPRFRHRLSSVPHTPRVKPHAIHGGIKGAFTESPLPQPNSENW